MEGRIALFPSDDTSGRKPHYKGFIDIGGESHEFALWPAKSGKGFSGIYKSKTEKNKPTETQSQILPPEDKIPF